MITIENKRFKAAIRMRGAELASFYEMPSGQELIWQAAPEVWAGSAPILFPIVGKLKNGATQIGGKKFKIPKHGLLRTRYPVLIRHEKNVAVLKFNSTAETLKYYPFHYGFIVTFQLSGEGLEVNYEILNTGSLPMLFSVGSHPAFALDLKYFCLSEYTIEFSNNETLDLYGLVDGFLAKRQNEYLKNQKTLSLSETIFDKDVLIFKNVKSRKITLQPSGIEIDMGNSPHLGIWAKPNASFVCIEPWHSFDDASGDDGVFENKPGIMMLWPNETFETGYTINTNCKP